MEQSPKLRLDPSHAALCFGQRRPMFIKVDLVAVMEFYIFESPYFLIVSLPQPPLLISLNPFHHVLSATTFCLGDKSAPRDALAGCAGRDRRPRFIIPAEVRDFSPIFASS